MTRWLYDLQVLPTVFRDTNNDVRFMEIKLILKYVVTEPGKREMLRIDLFM